MVIGQSQVRSYGVGLFDGTGQLPTFTTL